MEINSNIVFQGSFFVNQLSGRLCKEFSEWTSINDEGQPPLFPLTSPPPRKTKISPWKLMGGKNDDISN